MSEHLPENARTGLIKTRTGDAVASFSTGALLLSSTASLCQNLVASDPDKVLWSGGLLVASAGVSLAAGYAGAHFKPVAAIAGGVAGAVAAFTLSATSAGKAEPAPLESRPALRQEDTGAGRRAALLEQRASMVPPGLTLRLDSAV